MCALFYQNENRWVLRLEWHTPIQTKSGTPLGYMIVLWGWGEESIITNKLNVMLAGINFDEQTNIECKVCIVGKVKGKSKLKIHRWIAHLLLSVLARLCHLIFVIELL